MKKSMILLGLFVLPFIIILLPYFITDPFKVLYHYDTYTPENGTPMYINLNRGYVSTQMYIKNNPKYHYDSFIFGSSRSMKYKVAVWKKYLPDSAICFHFDGYGEPLYSVYKKIQYVDKHSQMNNVLLPIDKEMLEQTEPFYTPLHFCAPKLVDYENLTSFQMTYIRAYLSKEFLPTYLEWKLTGNIKPYMVESGVLDTVPYYYKEYSNEYGSDIERDSIQDSIFYANKQEYFYKRSDSIEYYKPIIGVKQKQMLSEIKAIFDKHHTSYKIIINPMYDQKKFCKEDIEYLQQLFGTNLYDFSGKNSITEDHRNYDDLMHFKVSVATQIIDSIYSCD